MLRERSHGCDEPTVADGALAQVRRFDLSLEEVHALTLLDHGELIGADELDVPRLLSVTDGPDTVEPGVLVVVAAAALAQEAAKSTDEAPGRAADVDADAREEVDGDGLVDEHERKQQKVPESNGARRWRSGSVSVKPSRMSSMFFGTGFKDRGASISSCHAPEAVRAAGANPIQLEQIRITGLVQVRCSFFHHHGVRRRLYQAPGPGGCYVDRPVRHHREFSKSNFPPWFGVGMGQSMESAGAGDTSHSWTVRNNVQNPWLEISSVAANERDTSEICDPPDRTSRVCDRDEGALFPSRVDHLADPKRRRDRR